VPKHLGMEVPSGMNATAAVVGHHQQQITGNEIANSVSHGVAGKPEAMFLAGFARSREMPRVDVDSQPLWHRVAPRAAHLLSPVL